MEMLRNLEMKIWQVWETGYNTLKIYFSEFVKS